ncbi:hypothetical protein GCM10017056_37870 [Seohaeicola zhoushanensis]|uniref:Uncharacterized protein n=1 Tax=Seohaeicola zhoushanensis TaxID=1569283 RepID=A0A8J3M8V5_9RHOB|nr:hypothetical protein GCM10017056_37870 [Seohaeicola zhoushanensis]
MPTRLLGAAFAKAVGLACAAFSPFMLLATAPWLDLSFDLDLPSTASDAERASDARPLEWPGPLLPALAEALP